jgi:hypothetical protein
MSTDSMQNAPIFMKSSSFHTDSVDVSLILVDPVDVESQSALTQLCGMGLHIY